MDQRQTARQGATIEPLQLLRAGAALSVFLFHYGSSLNIDFGLSEQNIFTIGAYGVDLFFVLSGFIICFAGANETSPVRFFIKRLCRILPLYYLLTFGVFAIALLAPQLLNSTTANPEHLAKSLLFIPYEGADGLVQPLLFLGWTLNYEMFFYLIFSLSILAGRHRVLLCTSVIFVLLAAGLVTDTASIPFQFFTSGIMLNFVWGCLAYLVWIHRLDVVRIAQWTWPIALAFILGQAFVSTGLPRQVSFGIPAAVLLLGTIDLAVPKSQPARFGLMLGDASYSLYLIHPYILQAIVKLALPLIGVSIVSVVVSGLVAFVLTAIASILLFQWIEHPSNIWFRRLLLRQRTDRTLEPSGRTS